MNTIPTNGTTFDLHGATYLSTGRTVTLEKNVGPVAAGTYLLANRWIKTRGDWAATPTKLHLANF